MQMIDEGVGAEALNRKCCSAISGASVAMERPAVLSAAIGDLAPLSALRGELACSDALVGLAGLGLVEPLRMLLARSGEVNTEWRDSVWHCTALNVAATSHAGCVQLLLEHGAKVEKPGHRSTLLWAVWAGQGDYAQLLLEHKAQVNCADPDEACGHLLGNTSGLGMLERARAIDPAAARA